MQSTTGQNKIEGHTKKTHVSDGHPLQKEHHTKKWQTKKTHNSDAKKFNNVPKSAGKNSNNEKIMQRHWKCKNQARYLDNHRIKD